MTTLRTAVYDTSVADCPTIFVSSSEMGVFVDRHHGDKKSTKGGKLRERTV